MDLNNKDLELINMVSGGDFRCFDEISKMSRDEIIDLTDSLGSLIGYDSTTNDIDALGLEADNVISKLLKMLEKRGEM